MTSPYLNRPRRGLEQALKDRGMTRADVGMALDARRKPAARGAGRPALRVSRATRLALLRHARLSVTRAAVAAMLVVAVAALGLILRVSGEPDLAESERAEQLMEIAPAAGPAVDPHDPTPGASASELGPAPTLAPLLEPAQALEAL